VSCVFYVRISVVVGDCVCVLSVGVCVCVCICSGVRVDLRCGIGVDLHCGVCVGELEVAVKRHIDRYRYRCRHTDIHTGTGTGTGTGAHARAHTHTHSLTQSHSHTDTQTHSHRHTRRCTTDTTQTTGITQKIMRTPQTRRAQENDWNDVSVDVGCHHPTQTFKEATQQPNKHHKQVRSRTRT
jgi:hypothetical protein